MNGLKVRVVKWLSEGQKVGETEIWDASGNGQGHQMEKHPERREGWSSCLFPSVPHLFCFVIIKELFMGYPQQQNIRSTYNE